MKKLTNIDLSDDLRTAVDGNYFRNYFQQQLFLYYLV